MKTGEAEVDDDVLDSEQETDLEEDQPQGEEQDEEGAASEGAEEGEDAGGEEEETVVQIGNEEPPTSETSEADSTVFADLRKRYRELARENAKLKAQTQGGQQSTQQAAPKLRDKPTLEAHEFDAEKFEADLDKWHAEKREVEKATEAQQAAQRQALEAQQNAAKVVRESYDKSKASLKVKDFQEAEDEAATALDQVQQSIVIAGAANPALVVYALGKNPKKLAELASIKDPVKFAVAVGKLETEVKVTKRTSTKPAPEKTVSGGGSGSVSSSNATLDRLRAEADKTCDRSKVAAYLRKQRAAGK